MTSFMRRWRKFFLLAVGYWALLAWLTGNPLRSLFAIGVIVIMAFLTLWMERKTGYDLIGPRQGQRRDSNDGTV